jgi:7,8-dihydro-6-hydroxymethylpterin-pyrophosphokinase
MEQPTYTCTFEYHSGPTQPLLLRSLAKLQNKAITETLDLIRSEGKLWTPDELSKAVAERLLRVIKLAPLKMHLHAVGVKLQHVWGDSPSLAQWKGDIPSTPADGACQEQGVHVTFGSAYTPEMADLRIRSRSHSRQGSVDSADRDGTGTQFKESPPGSTNDVEDEILVALGSNMGDRVKNIETACNLIDADADIQIVETSKLFESHPMYVEDQGNFLNGVCRVCNVQTIQSDLLTDVLQIKTHLPPVELLDRLQKIENDMGRVKVIDKGPRNIDLDIIVYGKKIVNTPRLTIPHPAMVERAFVLLPICEYATAPIAP